MKFSTRPKFCVALLSILLSSLLEDNSQTAKKLLAGMKRLLSQTIILWTELLGSEINYSLLLFSLPGVSSIDPIHFENASIRKLISVRLFNKNNIGVSDLK